MRRTGRIGARWTRRAVAALIVLSAVLLRVGLLDRHALWADELFSLAIATGHSLEHPADRAEPSRGDFVEEPRPVPAATYSRLLAHDSPAADPARVIRAVRLSDTSPPLYYLALWAWTRALGTSDAALRLFSVAWWLACLPPLAAIAGRLGGARAVLPAILLFCASPLSLYYSTEGRMYSMLWCLVLTTALLTLGLHRGRRSAWRLGAWIAVSAAGLLTHYFFVFPWSACFAWLLLHPGSSRRWKLLAAAGLTALLVSPWYVHLTESLAGWRVTRDWLKIPPANYGLSRSLARLGWSYFSAGRRLRWNLWTALNLVILSAMVARGGGMRWCSARRRLLWGWLLAALLGPAAFDLLRGTYTVAVPRYAIAGMPAAYLLAAVWWARLSPASRFALGASFVLAWAPGIRAIYREDRAGEPFRQVGGMLARQARDSDLVIVHSIPSGVVGVARYLEESASRTDGVAIASWVGQLGRRTTRDLETLIAGRGRVRLVVIHAVGEPTTEEEWLRREAVLVTVQHLQAASILDFEPRGSDRFPVPGAVTGGALPGRPARPAVPKAPADRRAAGGRRSSTDPVRGRPA